LIFPKLRKVNERYQGHYVSGRSLLYNGGSRSCAEETVTSNGFRKRSPTTAAAPGHGKHGKWISEAVGRYMTLSLKNFGYNVYETKRVCKAQYRSVPY